MTAWEERVLNTLAERFPSSAAAEGGRELRLRTASAFPELRTSGPDEAESFLEAAEALEREGIVAIQWGRHRRGDDAEALVLIDPVGLYGRLGRTSPVAILDEARSAAKVEAVRSARHGAFFAFLCHSLRPQDAAGGVDAGFIAELGRLTEALRSRVADGELSGITPRALSVLLFSDSKRLERLAFRAKPLVQRALEAGVEAPDLSSLSRNFPDTMMAGKVVLHMGTEPPLVNSSGLPLGLPWETARAVQGVDLAEGFAPKAVLFVENKETFHALSRTDAGFGCLVYTAGHPNQAVASIARVLARSGFRLCHAGDLDPDGLLILQELSEAAGASVEPYRMDAETFDRYLPWAYPLDAARLARFAGLSDGTRRLGGIESLVQRILSVGKGVEQEIIEY